MTGTSGKKNFDNLTIVNYCHPNCQPLFNIMRLPKERAFELAYAMASQNRKTTAFYRFADFENYYPKRLETDALLHSRFQELGGIPVQEHPLSFVLEGSDFLAQWFAHGIVTKFLLCQIPSESVSFTYGDSMTVLQTRGEIEMLTKDMLRHDIEKFDSIESFLFDVSEQWKYIEVQVWDDRCLKCGETML